MIAIGQTLISDEVLTERFVCHIEACKAACCVEGDAGAPLQADETQILEKIQSEIRPFLSPEGIEALDQQGAWVLDAEGERCTPLIGNRECAYAVYDSQGILQCGIENAWQAGATTFRKPISCHLYPIRIKEHTGFTAVNYHRWQVCQPACALGNKLGVPVFRFLKDALIRRFGEAWYAELEVVAESLHPSPPPQV
jgi:Protein of unknown function (DUF3109)